MTAAQGQDAIREALAQQVAKLRAENERLRKYLEMALRYVDVSIAYRGAMTAGEVEAQIIANRNISHTEIAANSCHVLAQFDIQGARDALRGEA